MFSCVGELTDAPVELPPYGSKPTVVAFLYNRLGLLVALGGLLLLVDIGGNGGGDRDAVDWPFPI